MNKTNALRQLDSAHISYRTQEYEVDEDDLSGMHVAAQLNIAPEMIFKTLVCTDEKNGYHVFCIPVNNELDLKKCAQAAGVKRIEMLPLKNLLAVTGYIRGGCSPVGMKKQFPTVIDETAQLFDEIYLSAGIRGMQMIVDPIALLAYLQGQFADIVR